MTWIMKDLAEAYRQHNIDQCAKTEKEKILNMEKDMDKKYKELPAFETNEFKLGDTIFLKISNI